MNAQEQTDWIAKWAACATLYVARYRFSVLPIGRESKKPLVKWIHLQKRRPTMDEILEWPKENLAIVTGAISNLVVVDCDCREDAEWFWRHRGKSPTIVQTKRGFHFYFRHPGERVMSGTRIQGHYDVKGDGGYVLAPPSLHGEGAYLWVKPLLEADKLPVFQTQWRPASEPEGGYEAAIRDGVAYIQRIVAVAGQAGHDTTYRAVWALRNAGLRESEALLALQEWNRTNADPPWTERELLHKIASVFGKSLSIENSYATSTSN